MLLVHLVERTISKPLAIQGFFLFVATFAYCLSSLPALSGGFVLDDKPNLSRLEEVKTTYHFWSFTFSGIASQLGRPLSLFSFALQAEHWPDNPYPFKLVGLWIHIANAWLLYGCGYLLARIRRWQQRDALLFAGSLFILWLFHPLNISTTFYVVQRMTSLAAFFSLFGVFAFLWGLERREHSQWLGITIATLGIGIAYVFGVLSKENAILIGFGIAILYWILLRDDAGSKRWDHWVLLCGVLPPLLVLIYLLIQFEPYQRTEFGPFERLLSQAVILQDYLLKILLPTPGRLNIFNDGFPVAHSLFESVFTAQAVLFWISLTVLSFVFRKLAPFIAFGILWFLSGHLLESSIFNLELYFEHRNYVPSIGILIAVIGTTLDLARQERQKAQANRKGVRYASLGILLSMLIGYMMVYGAEIATWRSPGALALSALTERPNSMRAHQEAAAYFANSGDFASAALLANVIEQRWSGQVGTYSQLVMLKCLDDKVILPNQGALLQRLESGPFDRGALDAWHQILNLKKADQCQTLSWTAYRDFIERLLQNPNFRSQADDFVVLLAFSLNAEQAFQQAASALDRVPEDRADLDYRLLKARFYAVAGDHAGSLAILARAKAKYANDLRQWLPRKKQIESLEVSLQDSLKRQDAASDRTDGKLQQQAR